MAKIAVLGTGLLGSGMIKHFLNIGQPVTAWNRTEAKARALEADGAMVTSTPEAAVAGADHVHFVLMDDAAVEDVLTRITPALKQGAMVVDHSTTLPDATKTRVERLHAAGIRYVHAPVFMSPQMATDGAGLMLVSARQADFDEIRPELEDMTGQVWYFGERPDLAAAYKLFGNCMLFAISGGLADIVTMARANDIDALEAMGLFTKFQVGNIIQGRGPRMARSEVTPPSFSLEMARKDVGLMIEAAKGQPLVALPAVAKRMDEVIAEGGAGWDVAAIGPRAK